MVFSHVVSAAIACQAFIVAVCHADSLNSYPTMDNIGDTVALDSSNPAIGAEWTSTTTSSSTTDASSGPGVVMAPSQEDREYTATTSRDLSRLETFFGTTMVTDITKLATAAAFTPEPWPSSYWPIYQDSINVQWNSGDASPAEKYAKAFGLDADSFMDTVSQLNGIDSQSSRTKCTSDNDCTSLGDSSACAMRTGKTEGYCIPTWFGICHAWAPAAILEPEPNCPVTKNDVTFEPLDLKALMSLVYDGAGISTVFTGVRFNGNDNEPDNTDEYGRFKDAARRDIGPGFFHIAIANILGIHNQSFVVDVTAGAQVWNQPVRSYEVREMAYYTPQAAAQKFYKTDSYPFNDDAVWLLKVTNRFEWMVESGENGGLVASGRADAFINYADYEYLLELDANYNIIGGEWLDDSNSNHPDFLWLPTAAPASGTVTQVGLSYDDVKDLLTESANAQC